MFHATSHLCSLAARFRSSPCLIASELSAVTPNKHLLLADRTASLIKSGKLADISVEDTQRNYKRALEKGVLKILSKMGISLLSCYHGAQIFEIYGLGDDIVDTAFRGSVSRIGGMSFDDLQKEVEPFWIKVSPCCMVHATHCGCTCHVVHVMHCMCACYALCELMLRIYSSCTCMLCTV